MREAIVFAAVLCVACAPPPEVVPLVVNDVTVIDPLSGQVLPGHSVFVRDRRIAAVEPSGPDGHFVAVDTVDGTGRYLIPGLIDSHVHLFRNEEVANHTLDLLLANGVTGVREMASGCWGPPPEGALCGEELRALDAQVEAGERLAPRLLALSSAPVSISEGRLADMVLLNADPLADIENVGRIEAVFLGGEVVARSTIDEMLSRAETTAAESGG